MSGNRFTDKKGYTLLEILIGVAVLVIFLAISLPAVVTASRDLNMTKLDAAAKEIFTAAQNRLTAMKASGQLTEFSTELNSSYAGRSLTNFMAPPADYPSGDAGWQGFFYLASDDPVFQEYIMSDTAFAAIEGRYIVELNPDSGDIFGVFYAEYDDGAEFISAYESYAYFSRSEEDRRAVEIGYYSGSDLSASILPDSFQPTVTVHNNEELYLEITCQNMLQFAATRQYLTLKLTMTDEHGGVWEKSYNGLSDLMIAGGEIQLYVLLDSMRAGASFRELTGLYPGDNITAVATMEYSYRGKDVTTDSEYDDNTKTFNSLFDSISEANGSQVISISKLRHLNNLRSDIFGYTGNAVGQVAQIAPIYFDAAGWAADEWCPTTANRTQPLSSFTPIVNDGLFGSSVGAGSASFAGGMLYDMAIGGGSAETGLIAHANCDISGFRFIDPQINGGSYTGTLAGRVYGGTISECGAYLTNANGSGVPYGEDVMAQRVAQYRVNAASGSANVGGLVGAAQGSARIEQSYAAVNVGGSVTYAGGLVGSFSGSAISQCYSSGDVFANAHAGGLAGSVSAGQVSNCYTTSDVSASSCAGGFVGDATGGRITGCVAYGMTKKPDDTTDLVTSGAFIGSGDVTFEDDSYLRQNGYNSDYDDQAKRAGIEAKAYSLFKAEPANSPSNSFPYSAALQGLAYPFAMLTGSHYGDWPLEASIETSLIYYEKYTNSRGNAIYGYYADGYAKTGEGETASVWNLNTLKTQGELDRSGYWLTEDGYAVLSIYNLVQMKYKLNGASQVTLNVNTAPGANRFVLMENPSSLPLSAIDKDTGEVIGQFSAQYLYVFQLPFGLQETNRDASYTFYDQLVMSGYAKGNLDETVFADYTFYYCPHFARNAINPDVNQSDPGRPKYSNSPTIYVRSARQLNALGRYSYYWSKVNAPYSSFIFSQEIDINFSNYTKTYCGVTFDLTSTASTNAYRNRPIGKPMAQSFTDPWGNTYSPGNFQNTYNGNCHKIIDYRLRCYASEDVQFAGLFGEIMNATIRNIIMVASSPGSPGSGYVVSEYNSQSGRSAGTGALVGLSYAENKSQQCTIANCTVSGYTVVYYNYTSGGVVPNNVATGGLIGYNMGVVTNCSADSYLVAAQISDANSKLIIVSGLIGSCTNGAVSNCYAGGTLEMTVSRELNSSSSINGLSRNSYVWAPYGNGVFTVQNCYSFCTIINRNTANYRVYGGGGPTTNLTDSSSGSFSGCYYLTDSIGPDVTVTTSGVSGSTARTYAQLAQLSLSGYGSASASRTYPWSTAIRGLAYPFPASVINEDGAYVHYGDWPARLPQPVYLAYYETYSDGSFGVYFFDSSDESGAATDTISNTSSIVSAGYGLLRMKEPNFSYIASFRDAYGQPLSLSTGESPIGDVNDQNGVAYQLFAFDDASTETLCSKVDNALQPEQALSECELRIVINFVSTDGQESEDQVTTLYVNPRFARAITESSGMMGQSASHSFDVRTVRQLCAVAEYGSVRNLWFIQTRNVNAGSYVPADADSYAGVLAANSTYDGGDYTISGAALPVFGQNNGTVKNVALSGSADALIVFNTGALTGCTVEDGDVSKAGGTYALLTCTNTGSVTDCAVDGCALTLTGSANGALAVGVNSGNITDVTVADSQIAAAASAAGFVYSHSAGTISNCTISTSSVVSQTGEAAGFVYSNAKTIASCAAVHTDVIATRSRAAGFVISNASGGSITSCYVAPGEASETWAGKGYGYASVTVAGASAYGFAGNSMGGMSYCFAVGQVESTGGSAAGFAQTVNQADHCFSNCTVSATGTGAVASGFAIDGLNIIYSYSCGSAAGPVSCGFLNNGNSTTTYCYAICSLPDSGYGFAPATVTAGGNCYWVKDTQRSFNTALTAQSAGAVKTFYELSRITALVASAAANPFDTGNTSTYPYAISSVKHMGNWPANPAGVPRAGYIGIAKVQKSGSGSYTYSYYGYDCAGGNTYQNSTVGPQITFSGGNGTTRFYLYASNDLSPALNSQGGWTYSDDGRSMISGSGSQTSNGYSVYQITYYQTNAYITFYLDGTQMFRIRYRTNSGGTLSFS